LRKDFGVRSEDPVKLDELAALVRLPCSSPAAAGRALETLLELLQCLPCSSPVAAGLALEALLEALLDLFDATSASFQNL
jgi:hypothetical protein